MARALIVGCGCRGRQLGGALRDAGWAVRGTSRGAAGLAAIEAAGIDPAPADPGRPATVLDLVGDVTVVHWLLGSAEGDRETLEAVHGPRLERLLERLVDTPVRGVLYEAAGSAPAGLLAEGAAAVRRAAETWRIPVAILETSPAEPEKWLDSALSATLELAADRSAPSPTGPWLKRDKLR